MMKIPTVFVRDLQSKGHPILPELAPGCGWALSGQAHPTRKRDGTATRIDVGMFGPCLWKRYDAKHGKPPPDGFQPAQDPDPQTGHWPGWVLARSDNPADRYLLGTLQQLPHQLEPGTYEFCGPKVNANPEGLEGHAFFRHGAEPLPRFDRFDDAPALLAALAEFFAGPGGEIEGIVWWHAGRPLGKVKRRDFGLPWPLDDDAGVARAAVKRGRRNVP